ncbi:TIGR00730 family Rossman fold protein [Alkalicoccus urumqiensis]|uniref:Cytokinin riboside 5'-monophosphate phosphoribohydrolase n=1 Tax=Alkalicoccus urumqiensis TaxID=1548213 RepID=A0A2P6MIZ1_ALKUR|nr:TIGR00730 family Rossman fold protein [Alkalicoccus urumqiensis]PRO66236.1 TIGR00730 family Rossman fold protein [Alkalicoccus urumqiensis]
MKRMTVYCGSSTGNSSLYERESKKLGEALAEREIELVYGGGAVGMMGVTANAVLNAGGRVTGVMPRMLSEREVAHPMLTELLIVDSMHDRKAQMADLADGFLILPGGAGTMEEFFEMFTWAQLGIHKKPIGILNVDGYYDPLLSMFDHMIQEGFLHESYLSMIQIGRDSGKLIDTMQQYDAPSIQRYVNEPDE